MMKDLHRTREGQAFWNLSLSSHKMLYKQGIRTITLGIGRPQTVLSHLLWPKKDYRSKSF